MSTLFTPRRPAKRKLPASPEPSSTSDSPPAATSCPRFDRQGVVEDEAESAVLFKTQADRVDALIQRIKTLHSYEVPDIVAYPVERGHAPYLDWVRANS